MEKVITSYKLCRGMIDGEDFEKNMKSFLEEDYQPYGNLVSDNKYIVQPMIKGEE